MIIVGIFKSTALSGVTRYFRNKLDADFYNENNASQHPFQFKVEPLDVFFDGENYYEINNTSGTQTPGDLLQIQTVMPAPKDRWGVSHFGEQKRKHEETERVNFLRKDLEEVGFLQAARLAGDAQS